MHMWVQHYTPLGTLWLSALVAMIPIVFFFLALTVLRLKGHVAGILTLLLSVLVAIFAYQMPVTYALSSAAFGFLYGLWPISWIIITAVFLYKITVKTGQFDIIRSSIVSITADQRLQVILVAFCFGAFLEGAAGFGAPVAITAALLVGLGLNPLYAAGLCLIANTAPVAFGALGVPIKVAGLVSGESPFHIGQIVGRQLPFLAVIVPFWLVAMMDGVRGLKQTWPGVLVAGGSFAIVQFITSNFIGPELPDVTSALVSLVVTSAFLRHWHPKEIYVAGEIKPYQEPDKSHAPSRNAILKAWSPFILLTVLISLWSVSGVKNILQMATLKIHWPFIDHMIQKGVPFATNTAKDVIGVVYKFDILSAVGTAILLAAVISAIGLRMKPADMLRTFAETLYELRFPILSIGCVLGFAFVANYSGLASTLALMLAQTGKAFPFFAPFLGWLGVFLTGSDTSANALFSNLQANTAQQLHLNSTLMVASNSAGGVTGKMISPQSIAVACGAVGLAGKESNLFSFTVKHSIIFCVIIGAMNVVMQYLIPWTLLPF